MKFLRFLGNELLLGALVVVLSVMTALASYQGATADSEQNKFEIEGMKALNDGNADFLGANQSIIYDYQMYDGWYAAQTEDLENYYSSSYSPTLQDSIARNPDDPFSDQYYKEMYAEANSLFDQADVNFDLAGQWDTRGDQLQLVMLFMALGLSFAAWASLLRQESRMRVVFALLAVAAGALGFLTYLAVPVVAV